MDRNYIKRVVQLWCLLVTVVMCQHSYAQTIDPKEYYESFSDCNLHYPGENRVFLESQSWWVPDEEIAGIGPEGPPDDFGHLRVGTCFPLNQQRSGIVPFKLQITFHNYPYSNVDDKKNARFDFAHPHMFGVFERVVDIDGKVKDTTRTRNVTQNIGVGSVPNVSINDMGTIRIGANPKDLNASDVRKAQNKIAEICKTAGQDPDAGFKTCVIGLEFDVDTNEFPSDGVQEIRFFTSILEPDGQENHVTTGWPLKLANGKTERNYRGDGEGVEFQIQGRGWYTGLNYATGSIYDYDPSQTVDESWTPHIESDKGTTLGAEVTNTQLCLNADFDSGNPGLILLKVEGELSLNDPMGDHDDKMTISMTLGELLNNAVDESGARVYRDDTRFFENEQLKPRDDGKPHQLAVRTDAGCDVLDGDAANDCDCAFNANKMIKMKKDQFGNLVPRTSGGFLQDGVVGNGDDSCLHKDKTFYNPIAGVNSITKDNNTPTGVDNHAQKTVSMLVVPFHFHNTATPPPPVTHVVSVESLSIVQGDEPVSVDNNGNDASPLDLTVNITVDPPIPAGEVEIALKTKVGSAKAGNEDFNWMNPKVVVSGDGQAYTFSGLINNNGATDSGPEEFFIEVSIINVSNNVSGNVEAGPNAIVTINKQADSGLSLSVSDVTVDEGAGKAVFKFLLSEEPGNQVVRFDFSTANGTALSGSDYDGRSGRRTMRNNETVKYLRVDINDDAVQEGSESFSLNVSNVIGAEVSKASGTVTIEDND